MQDRSMVLIVDDVELNRAFLSDILGEEYWILEACDGIEALAQINRYGTEIGIVLLDIIMPEKDGFGVLEAMKKQGWMNKIPVVLISAENSSEYISRAYGMGAADYISRPFDANIIKKRVANTLMLYMRQQEIHKFTMEQMEKKSRSEGLLIDLLSTLAEFKTDKPRFHTKRVRLITKILLNTLGKMFPKYNLDPADILMISDAAALHDIGKFVVSENVLNDPGKLEQEEMKQVRMHAEAGAAIIRDYCREDEDEFLKYAADICLSHHERWDGTGYPNQLRESDIPLCAQVVGLADAYDVLISKRAYKQAYSHEQAMRMLLEGECGGFNPDLLACLEEAAEIIKNFAEKAEMSPDEISKLENRYPKVIFSGSEGILSDRTLFLLEQERIKYQFLAALSNEVLFEYDLMEDKLTLSERAHEELGVSSVLRNVRKDARSLSFLDIRDIRKIAASLVKTSPEAPFLKRQCLVKLGNGTKQWYEFTFRSMWNNGLSPSFLGFIGKMTNIHDRKLENLRLTLLAERDPLTGLYNQASARHKIEEILSRESMKASALLFFDFDDFKDVNDTLGHAFGDKILCHIADTIVKTIRTGDIAARVGGDEFIIFLSNISDVSVIERRADDLFKALCGTYEKYDFSVSMGAAVYPRDGEAFEALYDAADRALYVSKGLGKKQYTFYNDKS